MNMSVRNRNYVPLANWVFQLTKLTDRTQLQKEDLEWSQDTSCIIYCDVEDDEQPQFKLYLKTREARPADETWIRQN